MQMGKLVDYEHEESNIITSHSYVETSKGIYLSAYLFIGNIVEQILFSSKVALHAI